MDNVNKYSFPSYTTPNQKTIFPFVCYNFPKNQLNLIVGRVRTDKWKYLFTKNVINLWNSFQEVVMVSGLDEFQKLDRFLEGKYILCYNP